MMTKPLLLLVMFFLCSAAIAAEPVLIPLQHVFLIVMENHGDDDIIGNPHAPFINRFAHEANLARNYFAVGHPSLPNYLSLVGGSNFGVRNDDNPDWSGARTGEAGVAPLAGVGVDAMVPALVAPFGRAIPAASYTAQSLGDQLVAAGKRWKSYQQNIPASGVVDGVNFSDGVYSNRDRLPDGMEGIHKRYAAKHNPFVYFATVQQGKPAANGLQNVVGFDGANGLYADLSAGRAPALSFIVPDLCHDMHGAGERDEACGNRIALIEAGDATVRELVQAIHASPAWQTGHNALVVVWDENSDGSKPNRVPLIVETSDGVHGVVSERPYSHFSLLKTLEAGFHLPCLNHACDPTVLLIQDLFSTK